MTRPQIKLYWFYLQRRIVKDMEHQMTVMWGYDPAQAKQNKNQKLLAQRWLKDPLFAFPDDITYFNPSQIGNMLGVSRRFGPKMTPEKRWTQERADACSGKYGRAARRCSMNDKLWRLYQISKKRGLPLTLPDIKKLILIDIKRSKLYPPGWTDDTASPPEWYLKELRQKGILEGILKEIDQVTRS